MPTQLPGTMASHVDVHPGQHFFSSVVWAIVGGTVVLAAYAALLTLSMTVSGTLPGAPMHAGGVTASPTYHPILAGMFMAGALVVLIARGLAPRSH